jgi:hypothetical protein
MSHLLASLRLRAWFSDLDHDAQDGETRLVVVADSPDGFGPGFDRETLATLTDGQWLDADGWAIGPIVAVSPCAIHGRPRPPETDEESAFRTRASDSAQTIDAPASPEALAQAALLSVSIRTVVACLSGALWGFAS